MEMKEIRLSKKLTRIQLANMCGVSHKMIYLIETGKRRPSPELATKIGNALDLKVFELWNMFYEKRPTT